MKRFVALMLACIMALSMVACGTAADKTTAATKATGTTEATETYKPITIQFWNGWTGSDGQVLIELVERFNKENKWNITIEMDSTSDFRDKITPAMAANKTPALILGSCSEKFTYEGEVRSLDSIWEDTGMVEADFIGSYLDSLKMEDGKLYGIPFQISNYVLYWNKDLFTAAGLDPEHAPETYEEYVKYAELLTDADKHQYGSGLSYTNYGADACLMQMFGGIAISKDENGKWQANFKNNNGYSEFVKWFNSMYSLGYNPQESDIVSMFVSGQMGMYVDGPWVIADLKKYGVNYGVTTLIETEEGGKQSPSNTQCFFICTDCTDEEALAAERLIYWWHYGNGDAAIEDTGVYWWSDKIGYPTYFNPVAACEAYQNNADMKAITITDPSYCMDSVAPGDFPYWTEILVGPIIDFINNMTFYGDADPEELLDKCQDGADAVLKEKFGY